MYAPKISISMFLRKQETKILKCQALVSQVNWQSNPLLAANAISYIQMALNKKECISYPPTLHHQNQPLTFLKWFLVSSKTRIAFCQFSTNRCNISYINKLK